MLTFEKGVDLATTPLLYALARGDLIPKAVLTLFHRAKSAPVTLVITMGDVRLTKYDVSCDPDDNDGRPQGNVGGDLPDARLDVSEPSGGERPELPHPGNGAGVRHEHGNRCPSETCADRSAPWRSATTAISARRSATSVQASSSSSSARAVATPGRRRSSRIAPARRTALFRRFGYLFNEFAKISVISESIYRLGRAGGTSIEVDQLQGQGDGARGGAGAGRAALREVQSTAARWSAPTATTRRRSAASSAIARRASARRAARRPAPRRPSVRIARRRRRAGASATSAASTWRARTRVVLPAAPRCLVRRGSVPTADTASSVRAAVRSSATPTKSKPPCPILEPTPKPRCEPAIRPRRSSI